MMIFVVSGTSDAIKFEENDRRFIVETDKLEVPHFVGYEAFYGKPSEYPGCKVLSRDGNYLIDPIVSGVKSSVQICYRLIKPKTITFESVHDDPAISRELKNGEYGEMNGILYPCHTTGGVFNKIWRLK